MRQKEQRTGAVLLRRETELAKRSNLSLFDSNNPQWRVVGVCDTLCKGTAAQKGSATD
jgi:hypothetical protein